MQDTTKPLIPPLKGISNSRQAQSSLERFCRTNGITVISDFFLNSASAGICSASENLIWICAGEKRITYRNKLLAHEVCHWLIAEENGFRPYFDPRKELGGFFHYAEEITCELFAGWFTHSNAAMAEGIGYVMAHAKAASNTPTGREIEAKGLGVVRMAEKTALLQLRRFSLGLEEKLAA